MFADLIAGLGDGLLVVAKTAGPALLSGAVMKHGISKLNNDAIPYINGVLGAGLAALQGADPSTAVQAGVLTAVGGTGTHQLLKVGTRALADRWLPATTRERVGPGERLSI